VLIFPSNEDLQKEKELALKATFLPIFQGKTKQNNQTNKQKKVQVLTEMIGMVLQIFQIVLSQ
jgi:peptidoglycan biosynthesis protein MviN/MurJ (putative lipid II flippase)